MHWRWTGGGSTSGWYTFANWSVLGYTISAGPNQVTDDAEFPDNSTTNSVALPFDSPTIGDVIIGGDTDFGASSGSGYTVTASTIRIEGGKTASTVVTMVNGRIKT